MYKTVTFTVVLVVCEAWYLALEAEDRLITFKNPVRTSKRTPHFTITKINWLMLFKGIIVIYSENHAKPINTKYSITDC
jgi:hypothetical protein